MTRSALCLVLVALSMGCQTGHRPQLRSVNGLSIEPSTWDKPGQRKGRSGTAVTIQFRDGTEPYWRAEMVSLAFDNREPYYRNKSGEWRVFDFTVPVMKREPHALTLFFSNEETAQGILEQLPDQVEAGTLDVIPCIPNRVC